MHKVHAMLSTLLFPGAYCSRLQQNPLTSTASYTSTKPSHTLELATHHTSAISEHLMPASTSGAAYAKVPAQLHGTQRSGQAPQNTHLAYER